MPGQKPATPHVLCCLLNHLYDTLLYVRQISQQCTSWTDRQHQQQLLHCLERALLFPRTEQRISLSGQCDACMCVCPAPYYMQLASCIRLLQALTALSICCCGCHHQSSSVIIILTNMPSAVLLAITFHVDWLACLLIVAIPAGRQQWRHQDCAGEVCENIQQMAREHQGLVHQ